MSVDKTELDDAFRSLHTRAKRVRSADILIALEQVCERLEYWHRTGIDGTIEVLVNKGTPLTVRGHDATPVRRLKTGTDE